MALMAQNPNDIEDQIEQSYKMAAPVADYAAAAPVQMAPVDPHATLVAPIGPPAPKPVTMAAGGGSPKMSARTNELGDALPDTPETSPKMAASNPIKDHLNQRLMGDYQKDADPYGSPDNHPGFFGKLLHGLNVATGGVGRRQFEEEGGTTRSGHPVEGLEGRIQDIGKQESEQALQGSETGKNNEETEEMPGRAADTHAVSQAQVGNLNSETKDRDATTANPSLATAYAHAVTQAIKEGRDPSTDPIVGHLSDAIVGLQPKQNSPAEAPKTIQVEMNGKPHQMAWNPKTGKYDQDQGESGEKPQVVNVNAGRANDRAEKNDVLKAYQPTLDSAERMNVMTDNAEKALKDHDQQAMLSLLTNHLGMTAGLQKGMRINQAMINEAAQSQPWLASVKAKFDKDGYLSGVNLSPGQIHQMVDLARSRYGEDAKKSRSTAQYLGSQDDGPARTPGKATLNYYIHLAGGDPAKAKQLAGEDGWSVK